MLWQQCARSLARGKALGAGKEGGGFGGIRGVGERVLSTEAIQKYDNGALAGGGLFYPHHFLHLPLFFFSFKLAVLHIGTRACGEGRALRRGQSFEQRHPLGGARQGARERGGLVCGLSARVRLGKERKGTKCDKVKESGRVVRVTGVGWGEWGVAR